jgi:hypothetical protein
MATTERVTALLGSQPSTWTNASGTHHKWVIEATTQHGHDRFKS